MSTIAVVIPLYNGAAWIAQTLEAVLDQSRAVSDIVVVDDESTDGGPAIVEGYDGVRLLRNPEKGANLARVFGIASTDSEYLALLDQDDRYAPDHLEKLASILDDEPCCPAAVGNNTVYQLGTEPVFAGWPDRVERLDQWPNFPLLTVASPSGALIRRSALVQVGGWPTHIEGVADMLTFLKLSAEHPIRKTSMCTWSRGEHQGSYSAKLRGPGFTVKYMDRIIQAAEEARDERLLYYPGQEAELTDCLGRFLTIKCVLKALEGNDPLRLHDAVNGFDSAYADQHEQMRWLACNGLAWMVSLAGKRQADGVLIASHLLRHWPASASVTGELVLTRLESMLGRSLVRDYLRGAPLSPRRLVNLASSCIGRLIPAAKQFVRADRS